MKTKLFALLAVTFLSLLNLQFTTLHAQGTAFTYQGRFNDNGIPANALVEFQLTLWNAVSGGSQVAAATPATSFANVTNGLFTLSVDFGATAFDGADRYLQIEARTVLGPFTLLTPRQKITATPYALLAGKLTGTVTSGGLSGTYGNVVTFSNTANVFNGAFTGNGGGLTNLNATSVGGLNVSNLWKVGGNAGTIAGANFVGTTDNQPLELRANNQRIVRLEPIFTVTNVVSGVPFIWSNAPNVIGGSPLNVVDGNAAGVFIGGGGAGGVYADQGVGYQFGGTLSNRVSASLAAIVGGGENAIQAGAFFSTIGGGYANTIRSNATYSILVGGFQNTIETNSDFSVIGGGQVNSVDGFGCTIAGGSQNEIQSVSDRSTVGGGNANTISNTSCAMIAGGEFNMILKAPDAFIGAGAFNRIKGPTPGGDNSSSTIAGGYGNTIEGSASRAFIGGGDLNTNLAQVGTIGGGRGNLIGSNAFAAAIVGGFQNAALGNYSFAGGRQAKANHNGAFVWADSQNADFASTANNQFCIRANGGVQLSGDTFMSFGSTLSSKISLFGTDWGIGIQSGVQYYRVAATGGFAWYTGGVHNDNNFNNGGGVTRMILSSAGLSVNGTFVSTSDRNVKENFAPIQPRDVLEKVVALPLLGWNYIEDKGSRHIGPMAQDFYAAFGVGPDDKHIATVDADGVALAAIQGLNEKLNEELKRRDTENAELKARLEKLEQLLEHR